jgi:hypothetical protein
MLPVSEGACCAVASDGYIFAYDFALLPFMVVGEYFGDADLWGPFVFGVVMLRRLLLRLGGKESDLAHNKILNKSYNYKNR